MKIVKDGQLVEFNFPVVVPLFKGATTTTEGEQGSVPAPKIVDKDKFLKGDGTWESPVGTQYDDATTVKSGLMSGADKTKLNGITEGANKTIVDVALSDSSVNPVQNKIVKAELDKKAPTIHTHNYAGSSSAGGAANSALALTTNGGSAVQPVYFASGKPVACTYKLEKSVPANAVFTDTKYNQGNTTTLGTTKIYTATGQNLDGSINQKVVTDELNKKAPLANANLTGTPTVPTASNSVNTTQIASTAFVHSVVNEKIAAADAMIFKGTLGTGGTITALPATHKTGWAYKVIVAGTYAGQKCEIGDLVVCLVDGTVAKDSDWTIVQTNIDGAVTGPASSVANRVAVFDGATGKVIKDSGFTIATSVPPGAKFTDTVYSHPTNHPATMITGLAKVATSGSYNDLTNRPTSLPANGGNSSTVNGHTVLSNVPADAKFTDTVYSHPSNHPATMITGLANVAKTGSYNDLANKPASLPANGGNSTTVNGHTVLSNVPANAKFTDTTYANATTAKAGLMSNTDKVKLDGINITSGTQDLQAGVSPLANGTIYLVYE